MLIEITQIIAVFIMITASFFLGLYFGIKSVMIKLDDIEKSNPGEFRIYKDEEIDFNKVNKKEGK